MSLTAAWPLVHIPAFVVSDQPLFRALASAIRRRNSLPAAKVLGGAAEAKLGAADVERALVIRGPPRTPAWIAFTLATAVGDAAVAAELWAQAANTNAVCWIAARVKAVTLTSDCIFGPICCSTRGGNWRIGYLHGAAASLFTFLLLGASVVRVRRSNRNDVFPAVGREHLTIALAIFGVGLGVIAGRDGQVDSGQHRQDGKGAD